MLTTSQKKQLKGIASTSTIKYQIGKKEIGDTVIKMLENAIVAHELIKIDVMKSVDQPIMEFALDLSSKLNAEVVQVIGRVIVLFRRNKEKPKIQLVK